MAQTASNLKEFSDHFLKLFNELHKYTGNTNVKTIIDSYDKLSTPKIVRKFVGTFEPFENLLASQNPEPELFKAKLFIVPGVNLGKLWKHLNPTQQKRVWLHLQALMILGKMSNKSTSTTFNPFVGLEGSDDIAVEDLFKHIGIDNENANLINNTMGSMMNNMNLGGMLGGNFGMSSIMGMMNKIDFNKILDTFEIRKQIDIASKTEIDDAFAKFQEVTNGELSAELIDEFKVIANRILIDLKQLMQKSVNFSDMVALMEKMMNEMKPYVENGKLDKQKLISLVAALANNIVKTDIGNDNPQMSLIKSIVKQNMNMIINPSEFKLTPELMKQCTELTKGIDVSEVVKQFQK